MLGLVIDVLPSITARRAYLARQKVLEGLVRYVKHKNYKVASGLIQERVETNLEFGLGERMSGHAELILMFGILGNAVPSNFWLVANLFSRPALLQEIREEVTTALSIPDPTADSNTVLISAKDINMRSCPILYSCYRESLREISLLTSARMVLQDTILADKYFLRKDSVVQIAGGILGRDPVVWGANGRDFDPYRFLVEGKSESSGPGATVAAPMPPGVSSAAFRAFGGGTVICPGRHFAQTELMVFSAMVALLFDITDVGGGPMKLPEKDETRIPLSVMKPVAEPMVRIKRRLGWERVNLDVRL
jgi:hypothetical protein